jgi:hypothetical protein
MTPMAEKTRTVATKVITLSLTDQAEVVTWSTVQVPPDHTTSYLLSGYLNIPTVFPNLKGLNDHRLTITST